MGGGLFSFLNFTFKMFKNKNTLTKSENIACSWYGKLSWNDRRSIVEKYILDTGDKNVIEHKLYNWISKQSKKKLLNKV